MISDAIPVLEAQACTKYLCGGIRKSVAWTAKPATSLKWIKQMKHLLWMTEAWIWLTIWNPSESPAQLKAAG